MTTWNRLDYTKRTVASLISSGAFDKCVRFIVVDSGSTEEGMSEFLNDLSKYQKTSVLKKSDNRGWANAVNDGLALSRAEFVLAINNDIEFEPNFIEKMFDIEAHQFNIGILGVWRHTSHNVVMNGIQNQWFVEMDNVPAVGWLISKSVLQTVGLLNEKGICLTRGGNGEDTDYVGRVKAHNYLVGVPVKDLAKHIDGY